MSARKQHHVTHQGIYAQTIRRRDGMVGRQSKQNSTMGSAHPLHEEFDLTSLVGTTTQPTPPSHLTLLIGRLSDKLLSQVENTRVGLSGSRLQSDRRLLFPRVQHRSLAQH